MSRLARIFVGPHIRVVRAFRGLWNRPIGLITFLKLRLRTMGIQTVDRIFAVQSGGEPRTDSDNLMIRKELTPKPPPIGLCLMAVFNHFTLDASARPHTCHPNRKN
jgi:hypothetical protein